MADDDITTLDGEQGLSLDPISLTFGAEGGTQTVGVSAVGSSALSWEVEGSSLPDWLSVDPTSGVASDAETPVHVTVQENTSLSRMGAIIFSDGAGGAATLAVGQDGVNAPAIRVSPGSVSFAYGGGSETLTVLCNDDDIWYVDAGTLSEWCSVIPISGKNGAATALTVRENGSVSSRDCEIRFYTEMGAETTVEVTQEGVPVEPSISVEPESLEFPPEGGEGLRVTVTSSDGTAHADGLPSWLSVESQSGLTLYFTAEGNTGAVSRSGQVRIYNDAGAEVWLYVLQESAYRLAHFGEFPDIRGNIWRVEILRRDGWAGEAAELAFPADSPLVIEWPSIDFEDVIWGSSATLKVVSPGDRTYIDLYTIEPGNIRLDVYRDGSLWWSGMLDPEFYEEPYEKLRGYEVEMTFTDFGILERLSYDLEGRQKLSDMVESAVGRSGLNVTGITRHDMIGYSTLYMASENFTDEEGEVSNFHDVLEGILQPLGVRITQREGRILLFDIDGVKDMYDYGETAPEVEWSGDSQTLGVDKVCNCVKVTFSPYPFSDLADCDDVKCGDDDPDTYTFGTADSPDETDFLLTTSPGGSGFEELPTVWSGFRYYDSGRYFRISPVLGSADECSGALVCFRPYRRDDTLIGGTMVTRYSTNYKIYASERMHLPKMTEAAAARCRIRVEVPLLLDARRNPWDGDDELSSNQDTLETDSRWLFHHAAVTLYDDEGNVTANYDNSEIAAGSDSGRFSAGEWVADTQVRPSCWFEWYDVNDPSGTSGFGGGWKSNRHCIGRPDGRGDRAEYSPSRSFSNAADGEYIPYPAQGGYIQVRMYGGLRGYRWRENVDFGAESGTAWDSDDIYGRDKYYVDASISQPATIIRWWLVKGPTVEVVGYNARMEAFEAEDVEYSGTLNVSAKDNLEIDTICGTMDDAPPTARGIYLSSDGSQIGELVRARMYGRPEILLISQLYAQYAGRKAVITGEAKSPSALVMTEANQEGRIFLLTAETMDVRMGVSDIELRELGDDKYIPES